MKFLHKIIIAASLVCTNVSWAQSVLSVSDASMQPVVVMPNSYETDTKAMLEEWYLKNYAIIDYDADSKPTGPLTDEIIIERLGLLPTEIEMPYNSVVRSTIDFYARKKQLVENMLGLSIYYMPIFEEALERHKMPLELKYLPVIESALVPSAVSKAGASGLWQFMPGTATGLGLEINSLVDQRRDPYLSSDAAARYLKQLYSTYGDWSLAIAAYNCGPGNVNKALRRAGDGKHDFWEIYPFLPKETRGYVPAFIAANYIMNYHKEHNISPALAKRPIVVDTIHVSRRVHFDQISQVMDIPIDELRALNPQFRKDLIPGDIHPYSLVLPSLQTLAYVVSEDSIVNHAASKYSRRGVVEPASGAVKGKDSRGEYYDEETIKWHTVRRGETLSKIAKRYGTTVSEIRKLNRVGKKPKTGQKLKIKTIQRKYVETKVVEEPTEITATTDAKAVEQTDSATVKLDADTTATGKVAAAFAAPADTVSTHETKEEANVKAEVTQSKKQEAKPKKVEPKKTQQAQRPKTHKVARGENLSKIANRYGVTVKALKEANGLRSDNINAGQRLKIPQK